MNPMTTAMQVAVIRRRWDFLDLAGGRVCPAAGSGPRGSWGCCGSVTVAVFPFRALPAPGPARIRSPPEYKVAGDARCADSEPGRAAIGAACGAGVPWSYGREPPEQPTRRPRGTGRFR